MVDVPTNEPLELVAGNSWKWTRDLSDFPASVWTLTYYFRNAANKFNAVASADGDTHSVSVAPATTAAYVAGTYTWEAYATDGTDRYLADSGSLVVTADLSVDEVNDLRSHWQIVLDNVEAVIQNRATKDQLSYSISGRSLQRMPIADLMDLYNKAKAEVLKVENQERARAGLGNASKIKGTFV